VGANYVEANENLGKADLKMRIKISRKEGKESIQWLKLLHVDSSNTLLEAERLKLVDEAEQLRKIFSAISIKLDQ
jgi:four helix bundle protein